MACDDVWTYERTRGTTPLLLLTVITRALVAALSDGQPRERWLRMISAAEDVSIQQQHERPSGSSPCLFARALARAFSRCAHEDRYYLHLPTKREMMMIVGAHLPILLYRARSYRRRYMYICYLYLWTSMVR